MASIPLEQRIELARIALLAAERNANDANKNPTYWKSQVEQERKLVEALELELKEMKEAPGEIAG